MAPPARHPAAQSARRSTAATTAVSPRQDTRHEARRTDPPSCQLDWLQPALAIWLREENGPSVRMGDVHPTDGR